MTDGERVVKMYYAWVRVGDIHVYVADIEDDEDERGIFQQIDAMAYGWA